MPNVQMPDGKVVQFPDSMSQEDMIAASKQYVQQMSQQTRQQVAAPQPVAQAAPATAPAQPQMPFDQLRPTTQLREGSESVEFLGDVAEEFADPETQRGLVQATGGIIGAALGGGITPAAVPAGVAGATMAAQIYDLGRGMYDKLTTGKSNISAEKQALRGAQDMAEEIFLPKVLEATLRAGSGAFRTAAKPVETFVRKRVGNVANNALERVEAAQRLNLSVEGGLLGGEGATKQSQAFRSDPTTGYVIDPIDRHNINTGEMVAENIANALGTPQTRAEIGAATKHAALEAQNRFKKTSQALFQKMKGFVPERVEAKNITNILDEIEQRFSQSETGRRALQTEFGDIVTIRRDIAEDGTVRSEDLERIKEIVGSVFNKHPNEINFSDAYRKRIWKAADRDMQEAAINHGGKEGASAVAMAKEHYRRGKGNKFEGEIGVLDDVASIMKLSEDGAVYNWVIGEKAKGANRLKRVFDLVGDETAGDIRATVFAEMGTPTAGRAGRGADFSFETFLTNYNKLAPEARSVLFDKAGKQMDDLVKVSRFMGELQKRANFSNTATISAWQNIMSPFRGAFVIGGAVTGGLAGAAAGVGANVAGMVFKRRAARLFTDPDFVKTLAQTANNIMRKKDFTKPMLLKLGYLSKKNPDMASDYAWYLNQLGYDTEITTNHKGKTSLEVK